MQGHPGWTADAAVPDAANQDTECCDKLHDCQLQMAGARRVQAPPSKTFSSATKQTAPPAGDQEQPQQNVKREDGTWKAARQARRGPLLINQGDKPEDEDLCKLARPVAMGPQVGEQHGLFGLVSGGQWSVGSGQWPLLKRLVHLR